MWVIFAGDIVYRQVIQGLSRMLVSLKKRGNSVKLEEMTRIQKIICLLNVSKLDVCPLTYILNGILQIWAYMPLRDCEVDDALYG